MDQLFDIQNQIELYKLRLLALKQDPSIRLDDILFYEDQIANMEAEIAVADLMAEMEPPFIFKVTTDCWQIVDELCRDQKVQMMKMRWSWLQFKFVWYVEYIIISKCYL